MRKIKTMDCGYCPYDFCPVMESDGIVTCPYVKYVPDDEANQEVSSDE